jgi:hypothetical protein
MTHRKNLVNMCENFNSNIIATDWIPPVVSDLTNELKVVALLLNSG